MSCRRGRPLPVSKTAQTSPNSPSVPAIPNTTPKYLGPIAYGRFSPSWQPRLISCERGRREGARFRSILCISVGPICQSRGDDYGSAITHIHAIGANNFGQCATTLSKRQKPRRQIAKRLTRRAGRGVSRGTPRLLQLPGSHFNLIPPARR